METLFGNIVFPNGLSPMKKKAILRALTWCHDLAQLTEHWSKGRTSSSLGVELHRMVNGRRVSLYPLAGAKLDAAMEVSGFSVHHVPVFVDGNSVCVIADPNRRKDLHTDLTAALIMVLNRPEPDHTVLPKTLARALYPDIYFAARRERIMARIASEQRRTEVCEAFRNEIAVGEWGPGPIAEHLPAEDWRVLRTCFPWNEEPELAIEVASWMMDDLERSVGDHMWVMSIFREHDPQEYQRIMLPAYVRFHLPELRAAALSEYRPENPETAWEHLEPCLEDELPHLAAQAHETLQTYEQLEHRLANRSLELLEAGVGVAFQVVVVPWLSHRMDMDETIQRVLPTLEPHQLSRFLRDIETSGPWLQGFAEECLDSPFESVQMGMVDCTARNPSFNPFNVWLPLMEQGSGTMKLAILRNLHRVTEEQAHVLLELGWKSRWRFVIRNTHRIVEQQFPDYPRRQAMKAHGFTSVDTWVKG